MNELSLFTGAGGGVLGTRLLGWKHLGYVEFADFPQRVLRQRMLDGFIDTAPLFGDIRTFISDGYADAYTGLVDVVTGGFPCQPFSNAGKRLAENDPRNMWPATRDVIRIVRPRYALLENVPGLLTSGYLGTVFSDLARLGYDARWDVLGGADIGHNTRRRRLWILASADDLGRGLVQGDEREHEEAGRRRRETAHDRAFRSSCERVSELESLCTQSAISGGDDDVADRLDRLKAVGNGQVPELVATAWRILSHEA